MRLSVPGGGPKGAVRPQGKGNVMIDLFGLQIPTVVFVIVVVVALLLIIGIPMYQGYKKEMAKPEKKPGKSGKSGSKKR